MKITLRKNVLVLLVTLLAFTMASGASAGISYTGKSVPNEVLVKLRPGADLNNVEQQGDVDSDDQVSNVAGGTIWRLHSRSKSTDQLIATLSSNPNVVYAEANSIYHIDRVPNDPSYNLLYGMTKISAPQAWDVTTGSAGVIVGVVDTGIDYNHTDLAANIWSNPGGIGGCAAGTHGFNAITKTCDPNDDHYHGTHCAGTIGAVGNNGIGVAGVNWTVKMMGLKFLDANGSGSTADAISAIDFAVNAKIAGQNVRVLSNSWGGGPYEQTLFDEITKANTNNILFVAAAGNAGTNNDVTPHYPSSYNTPNMIAVAATDSADALASFSQYGAKSVHLGAPGVDIYSTAPANGYQYLSGTSMATPHVAGAAALVLAAKPTLDTAGLKAAILNNVDLLASLSGKTVTGGRLNVAKAVGTGAPCAPPNAPATLTATGGSGSVGLTWSSVTGATEYHVLRSTTSGSGYAQVGVSTGLSFTDSGLAAGTYYYVVRAFAGCESANSPQASATVTASPDFSLSLSPSSLSVPRSGGTATYTVTITRTGGFSTGVTLSVTGNPSTSTAAFSPNPATGGSSSMTITVSSGTARGTYPLTVTGTGGGLTRTASATLVITK